MAKWVCSVCGYVYEGEAAPAVCPVCKAPAEKFIKQDETMSWAAEHVVGVAKGVSEDILEDLLTERVIRKLACTTRKPLTKRLSTLLNSQSSWAKS